MRKNRLVVCEICGGAKPFGVPDFIVFHCLALCSPDCLAEYSAADDERRERKGAAAPPPQGKRAHAA